MAKKQLTLVIIEKEEQILLGMKKRGWGAGKWNGFGGKVEEETIEEAAVRETKEECGIDVIKLEERGVLSFEFLDNPNILEVHIFKALNWTGEGRETEEMKPQWFKKEEVPYEKMWDDDKYWLPLLLSNKKFKGSFLFDQNDQVLSHKLEIVSL